MSTQPNKWERIKAEIQSFLLKLIISKIGTAIVAFISLGVLSYLTSAIAISAIAILKEYAVLVYIGVSSSALWLFLALYYKVIFRKFIPQFPTIETSYKFIEKEIIHNYLDGNRSKVQHKRKYKIQILQNGIDSIRDYYWWSAGEITNITCSKNGYTITRMPRTSNMDEIMISFSQPLKKNQIVEFDIIWDLIDNGKALPYVSSKIRVPMDKLIFTIHLHQELKVVGATPMICYERQHVKEEFPFRNMDTNSCIKWEIEKPSFFHLYKLVWNWN